MIESLVWGLAGIVFGVVCVAVVRVALLAARTGPRRPGAPRSAPAWGRVDALIVAGIVIVAAGAVLALRESIGVTLPIGLDMELWSFAALDVGAGNPSRMEPGYPAAVALYRHLVGVSNLDAAAQVALLASVALPAMVYVLGRGLGAGRGYAAVAALFVPGQPRLLSLGQQVSPDSLTAVLICMLALSLALWYTKRTWGRLVLLLGVLALTTLVRHHGLVAAGLLTLLFLLPPDPALRRLGRAGLVGGVLVLAPLLIGQAPGLPTDVAWADRLTLVVDDAFSATPSWAPKIHLGTDPVSIFLHAVGNTPVGWGWVFLCLGMMVWARPAVRAAVWVTVATTLPTLVIFSQARHVLVVLPVTLAATAAVATAAGAVTRRVLMLAALGLFALSQGGWTEERETLMGMRGQTAELSRVGEAICARASEGDLASGDRKMFTFCPLPENTIRTVGVDPPGSLYRTWWVGPSAPGPGWTRVELGVSGPRVWRYRYDPTAAEMPCAASRTPPGLPYLALSPMPVVLDPPCTPAGWGSSAGGKGSPTRP